MAILKFFYVLVFVYLSIFNCLCESHFKSKPLSTLEIKKKITKDEIISSYWLFELLTILLGYASIVVPILLIVYLTKFKLLPSNFQNVNLLKIFVFGKQNVILEDDMESQLLDSEDSQIITEKKIQRRFSSLSLLYCFCGLQFSYLIWGLVQEKVMTTEYVIYKEKFPTLSDDYIHTKVLEPETIHFKDSQFLVLINRILAFIFALIGIFFVQSKQKKYPKIAQNKAYIIAPLYEFIFCSLSNVLSSWSQYEALKYVNFPTQVLSKACKLIAVMLMSQVVNKKSYKPIEYVFALSITFGMTFFLLGNHHIETNNEKLHINESEHQYHLFDGLMILTLYVTFDAFTSNWQGKLFDKYNVSSLEMMAAVNFYSILLTMTSSLEQGDFWPTLSTIFDCPALLRDCVLLSVCSASGQLFVFYTISTFGPLIFTTIMTLRQAFAILLSCLIYKHPLSFFSSFGICMVFVTLFYQIYWKQKQMCQRGKK